MKLVCVLFIVVSLNFGFVMPVNLQCSYGFGSFYNVGKIYQCKVQNNLNIISSESAVISGATGSHDGSKNNDDVLGFWADNKKIEIFPRGLEKIYKNLKLIIINFGRINEIHQNDLKPFSQLEYLTLDSNDIEVLEEGLFDFNPKLGFISFSYNKISQIHPNIFDHLTKLTYLWLERNQCIDKNVRYNSAKVKELINEVKLQCSSPYKVSYREIQKLKLNFNDQNLQLTEKLTKVENTCLNLNPKISSLEATSINVKNTVANLSTSSLSNKNELITLQTQILNLKEDSNKIKEMTSKQSQDALKMNTTIEETKEFITSLHIHQNQSIDKLHNLEASLNNFNVSASDVLSKINEIKATVSQQSEDIQAVNKKVQDTEKLIIASENRSLQKIHQNMDKVTGEINYLTMESKNNSDKFDKLEAESKTSAREALIQINKLEGLALKQSDKIQEINLKIASSENQIKASDTLHHQNIQELKTTTAEILKKIEDTEKRLILRQSEDIKAINLKIKYNEELLKALEAHQSKNIEEIEQKYKQEIERQEKAFNEKMEKLEAASKSSNEEIKRKIEELNVKNFNDIQAVNGKVQETEKLINASETRSLEKTNQNIEMVTQQIRNLKKNNSDKFDKLEVKTDQIDKMEARLVQKLFNDTQDIKSKIEANRNFMAESYMFHFEKIENLNTSVEEVQKKIKASEVKTLKIMEQKMQTLRKEMKAELEASTDKILRKIEQMESRLNSKQPNDVEVINSKIQVIKPSDSNSLKSLEADNKNLKILGDSAHKRITILNGYLTSTNNKVNQIEKALNSTDARLQTLKTEMMTAFGKIVEKFGENAAKIEQNITTKIKVMSTNLKDSYNDAFFHLHKNMKDIESGLAILNSELILNGIIQVSNDTKLNND